MKNVLIVDFSEEQIRLSLKYQQDKKILEDCTLIDKQESFAEILATGTAIELSQQLQNISKFTKDLDLVIVIIPATENINITTELPFSDPKLVKQVIKLQMTEKLAIDLDQQIISSRLIEAGNEVNQFQVSLFPKKIISDLLKFFKTSNIEPDYIITPLTALELLTAENSLDFEGEVIALLIKNKLYLIAKKQNQILLDRIIEIHDTPQAKRDLTLSILSVNSKINLNESKLVILNPELKEYLNLELLKSFKKIEEASLIDGIGKELININLNLDNNIYTNFRTEEFSFNRSIQNLTKTFIKLIPFSALLIFVIILFISGKFAINQLELNKIQASISEQIQANVPSFSGKNNKLTRDDLLGLNRDLESQLSTLGSNTAWSPLDSVLEISKNLERASAAARNEFQITGLSVNENKIILEGTSPNYSLVEKIDRLLSKNTEIFCKVDAKTSPGALDNRTFSFSINLCQK